jgi:hypothetical protein
MVALIEKATVVEQRSETPSPYPNRAPPFAAIAVPFAERPRSTHDACWRLDGLHLPL